MRRCVSVTFLTKTRRWRPPKHQRKASDEQSRRNKVVVVTGAGRSVRQSLAHGGQMHPARRPPSGECNALAEVLKGAGFVHRDSRCIVARIRSGAGSDGYSARRSDGSDPHRRRFINAGVASDDLFHRFVQYGAGALRLRFEPLDPQAGMPMLLCCRYHRLIARPLPTGTARAQRSPARAGSFSASSPTFN
jgi:hypothetical protein